MEVLGHQPAAAPRRSAGRSRSCSWRCLLNGLVSVVGVAGGYFFSVVVEHGTPGPYFASFTELAQLPDLYQAEAKAFVFGLVAALVASYQGCAPRAGRKVSVTPSTSRSSSPSCCCSPINFVATRDLQQVVPQKAL